MLYLHACGTCDDHSHRTEGLDMRRSVLLRCIVLCCVVLCVVCCVALCVVLLTRCKSRGESFGSCLSVVPFFPLSKFK